MKLSVLLLVLILLFHQPSTAQEKFSSGVVVTNNNDSLIGLIKPTFKLDGNILVQLERDGKKVYSPSEIKGFQVDSVDYISYLNDFYKVILRGTKASLYQKCTNNGGDVIYNGPDPVGFVKTTNGSMGDYYISCSPTIELTIITKKNFKAYFTDLVKDNEPLRSRIKEGKLGYAQLVRILEMYNNDHVKYFSEE